jgi:hypothetical protein
MTSSRITLYRSGSWLEGAQPYRIRIDGRRAGVLAGDGSLTVDVTPGAHTVRARGPWLRGCEETVTVGAGERKWVYLGALGFDLRGLVSPRRGLALVAE